MLQAVLLYEAVEALVDRCLNNDGMEDNDKDGAGGGTALTNAGRDDKAGKNVPVHQDAGQRALEGI